ncbi:MAG: hypothetical protein A2015_13530 [Spirochaetes bacterium GWF1_31_7]|nr:MAG: hypothetical protein A2Y30_11295 [Spirochaetes bacterium GWE1_32_154]OHD47934.1 MAG: hypothetical protein A2Y29_08115 [Spirochaetes bacterium GWE2_31_10]OHD49841.1 MAG: hypothetical protein A2015_13530 [Spirochaetes bacterium GWF1_31_7]HBD92911.1 hypothetical protein [Spirochaetia bacterium]HBI37788.1 hypothetical protein [Spirochaetia bacterium]
MKFRMKILLLNILTMATLLTMVYVVIFVSFKQSYTKKITIFEEELYNSKKVYLQDLLSFTNVTLMNLYSEAIFESNEYNSQTEKNKVMNRYKNQAIQLMSSIRHSAGTGYFIGVSFDDDENPYYAFNGLDEKQNGTKIVKTSQYMKEVLAGGRPKSGVSAKTGVIIESVEKNPVTKQEETKYSSMIYFRQWNWIVVTGFFSNELENKVAVLRDQLLYDQFIIILIITILSILIMVILSGILVVVSGRLIKPLSDISDHALFVSEGNLMQYNKVYNNKSKDEIAKLIFSFNRLIANFTDSARGMSDIAGHLEVLVNKNNAMSDTLSEITSLEASSIEQISASLEQSSTSIKHISESANSGAMRLGENGKIAENGSIFIDQITKSIENISKHSSIIEKSIDQIFGIAEQTNLLALNASIEAVKAGDRGKGFSVVSDEIRKLADKSKTIANSVNESIEENAIIVKDAKELIVKSEKTFKSIIEGTIHSKNIISEIASAIHQQAVGGSEMMQSASNIFEASQKMVSIAETSRKNSRTIEKAFNDLIDIIRLFKFERDQDKDWNTVKSNKFKPVLDKEDYSYDDHILNSHKNIISKDEHMSYSDNDHEDVEELEDFA